MVMRFTICQPQSDERLQRVIVVLGAYIDGRGPMCICQGAIPFNTIRTWAESVIVFHSYPHSVRIYCDDGQEVEQTHKVILLNADVFRQPGPDDIHLLSCLPEEQENMVFPFLGEGKSKVWRFAIGWDNNERGVEN